MKNVTFLSCKLVKENTSRYDVAAKISSPKDIYDFIEKVFDLSSEPEENLVMICLDTKNKVLGVFYISKGTLNASLVHPREVFKRALLCNSASIVVAHNHPSGDSRPSSEDVSITNRLRECGDIIGIKLLDHIIIGDGNYTSLKERGAI